MVREPNSDDTFPTSELEIIDQACMAFERSCKQIKRPSIGKFVKAYQGKAHESLVRELLKIELHYRRRWQNPPHVSEYVDQLPGYESIIREVFTDAGVLDQTTPLPSDGQKAVLPPPAPEDNFTVKPGDRVHYFGDYKLLEEIARGGMGVVYKARQIRLNRIVALKMILAGQLAGEEEVKRFYAEAKAAASLDHPNIVPVFEVGKHKGRHYFSMGFIEGTSLAARVANGPLPPKEAAQIVRVVSEAIAYAHRQGVIHRDLKPGNILLANEPIGKEARSGVDSSNKPPVVVGKKAYDSMASSAYTPKITDFGLAKKFEDDQGLTVTGQVLGTPAYMPPEQAAGRTEEITESSDVYSLGAILYCLLVGRPPFQAATATETILQVLEEEPLPPRQINPSIPVDLETIALKCLEKPTASRYASADEFAGELRRFQRGEPIHARPVGQAERGWRWCKRNSIVAGLTGGLTLVLIFGISISSGLAWYADINRQVAERRAKEIGMANQQLDQRQIELQHKTGQLESANKSLKKKTQALESSNQNLETALERAKQEEHLAKVRLYGSQITSAQRAWESGDAFGAWTYLNATPRDLRGWEHNYLHRLFNQNQLTLKGHASDIRSVAFSPDGKRIVSGSEDKTVKVWDASTGRETMTLHGHSGYVLSVAFSPDGKWIVSGSRDKTIKVWDASIGRETLTLSGHSETVLSVAFSPDGKRIVSGSSDGKVKVWDASTGRETMTFRGHTEAVYSVAFSPDGTRIVSGSGDNTAKVWDASTGRETIRFEGHNHFVDCVAFSPDGTQIVSCTARGTRILGGSTEEAIKVWDAATGREIRTLQASYVTSVTFSPDGKRIVGGSTDGKVKVWDASTGRETMTLQGHTSYGTSVAFSPDGTRIVSGSHDNTIKVWDASTNQETLTLRGHAGPVMSVSFSPDGKRIVSGSEDGLIKLWETSSGRETLTLRRNTRSVNGYVRMVNSVSFSPDGKRIVSGLEEEAIKVWDASTGRESLKLHGHSGFVLCAAFSPDGKRIVSGSRDKTVKVWDASTGREKMTLHGHNDVVSSVTFSPDGKRIISGSGDGLVKVWDASTGRETMTLHGHASYVASVAFSSNGKRIVSGSWDKTVKVWDAFTGRETMTLQGHTSYVTSVAFSPDGTRIVSDATRIKVWDAITGEEAITLNERATSVAFSPDGKRIVSGSGDRTIKVWEASTVLAPL